MWRERKEKGKRDETVKRVDCKGVTVSCSDAGRSGSIYIVEAAMPVKPKWLSVVVVT